MFVSSLFAYNKIKSNNKARDDVEVILKVLLFVSSLVAILTTLGIIISLLFESIKFFSTINIFDFLFGTSWSPQRSHECEIGGSAVQEDGHDLRRTYSYKYTYILDDE